ncbi:hypothetical protein ABZ924_30410 [Streptomyces sp. NPDC046876]|uniref:hypothetical protein n=1 Tax=Streptomyces sp. NPDC046876 TaxID=3155616 RepID=UPI0033F73045
MVKLGWIRAAEWAEVRFGTSRAGALEVPLYRTADVDSLVAAHPEAGWTEPRQVGTGERSPLAVLRPKPDSTPTPA